MTASDHAWQSWPSYLLLQGPTLVAGEEIVLVSIQQQTASRVKIAELGKNSENSEPQIVLVETIEVSTGLKGSGNQSGSGQTPLGWHQIRAKIGEHCPLNSVFVGRRTTGEIFSEMLAQQQPDRDWILTRIFWLSGLQKGFNRLGNCDSMRRYIYFHGTPDFEPMGVARSHGCIRLRNSVMMRWFSQLPAYTKVLIAETSLEAMRSELAKAIDSGQLTLLATQSEG